MAEVFCNQCGHRNPLGANFCSSCGAPLEHEPGEQHHVSFSIDVAARGGRGRGHLRPRRHPAGAGLLVVTRGPTAGSRLALTKPVTTVGRHPDSDIFLDDITVSRRHAELQRVESGFVVRDVGSLNGTYLNRERVEAEPDQQRRRAADRQVQARLLRRSGAGVAERSAAMAERAHLSIGEVLVPAAGGVPRRHDLEDPLPREPGPARPRTHAVGLPQVLRARHRAAAVDPAPAARELPAAAGDQGPPRRPAGLRAASTPNGEESPAELGSDRRRSRQPAPRRRAPSRAPTTPRGGRSSRGRHVLRRPSARRARSTRGPSAVSLTRDELARRRGLPDKIITELERYGLITGRPMGRDTALRRGRAGGRSARRRLPPLRRRGPPPADVQGGRGARGVVLRAGRAAARQAAQPRGTPSGGRRT